MVNEQLATSLLFSLAPDSEVKVENQEGLYRFKGLHTLTNMIFEYGNHPYLTDNEC